jgi:hypothetical protein
MNFIQKMGSNFQNILMLCALSMIANSQIHAQEVNIKQLEFNDDGDVVIHYDLQDEKIDRKFSLRLYASVDNYIQPLTNVSGDVGIDLAVGDNKKITWNVTEELGAEFKGKVALELKGSVYVPFVALDGFDDYKVLKRGKPFDVTWTGGRGDNILIFELYKGDNKVKVFEERPNVGNTSILIPTDVKPGKYKFKISDSRNRDEVVFTSDFQLKRKVPLVMKLGLGLVVGAALGVLTAGADSAGEEAKLGNPPLPEGN